MNEVKIFENPEFGRMRSVMIDGEPWFVGKDVATALGYENASKSIRDHVDKEDKVVGVQNVTPSVKDSLGRIQYPTWINESGVYALIFGSKLPAAKKFKHWVTSEVLPSIRKNGGYVKQEMDVTAVIMQTATAVCAEMIRQLTPILQGMVQQGMVQQGTLETVPVMGEYPAARCKMETFPSELRQQVDQLFIQMMEQQALNFSMISRYCTMRGYPISSPSVKTYYQRHFSDGQVNSAEYL